MFRITFCTDLRDKKNSILRSFYLFQEETLPPRPEAYPIPTQTYTREYFTFPASKSQDRMGPAQSQWPSYEEKPQVQAESNHSINSTMQVRSYFFHCKEGGGWREEEWRDRNSLISTSHLLKTFFQRLSMISELLRINHTTEEGLAVLLPRLTWVQKPYFLTFFFFFPPQNLLVIKLCRPVIWDILSPYYSG